MSLIFKAIFQGNPVMPGVLQIEAMANWRSFFIGKVEDPHLYSTYFMKLIMLIKEK